MASNKRCEAPDCARWQFCRGPFSGLGLCEAHYRREYRQGKKADLAKPFKLSGDTSSIPSLRLPRTMAKAITALAEAQGLSEYEFIRHLLVNWYERGLILTVRREFPYGSDMIQYSGTRIPTYMADAISKKAKELDMSEYELIRAYLAEWYEQVAPRSRPAGDV